MAAVEEIKEKNEMKVEKKKEDVIKLKEDVKSKSSEFMLKVVL